MFDSLVTYYDLTRDDQYNGILTQALKFQLGNNNNFMPVNQSRSEGNDDQATWALAGLSAEEVQIATGNISYTTVAETVFEDFARRWDNKTCGGGLRWQIFPFNNGYDFKNTASNGNFFQLAARLAQNSRNATYKEWATKTFEWTQTVGLMDDDWNVFEGTMTTDNCEQLNKIQWSPTAGTYIAGAASMYNATGGDQVWKARLDGLLNRTLENFFPDGIATETACEPQNRCNSDQTAYKGLLARQLVDTIQAAPYTADRLRPVLIKSAKGAAAACDASGLECGLKWSETSSDPSGLGQSLGALGFVQALLLWDDSRNATGGAGNATTPGTSTSGNGTNKTGSSGAATSSKTSGASTFSFGSAGNIVVGAFALFTFSAL